MSNMNDNNDDIMDSAVAIVGMSLRFPGADTPQRFWQNLVAGVDSVSDFSIDELDPTVPASLRENPAYQASRGEIADIELFDHGFFGLTPLEAQVMDPQQRLFLQVAWAALEDAGCVPDKFNGLIGVYAGCGGNTYFSHHVSPRPDIMRRISDYVATTLSEKDYIATRVAYCLNLTGPAMAINTACSTSLVNVATAVHHLQNFQCDAAIAGASSIMTPQKMGYLWQEGSNFSRTGRCRPFDMQSDGMLASNGVAAVVLKRLEDAVSSGDRIYAVIRGAAINNDGSVKIGFSAPSVNGQVEVISLAQAEADVSPQSVAYIEAHGTATRIGDQIELAALKKVFDGCEKQSIVLGSVKSNLGHLDAAAGMAGLIKAALAVYHRQIPPTIHFTDYNPELEISQSPFYINRETIPIDTSKRPFLAGVTSLGLGGTNAHVVLAEAPAQRARTKAQRAARLFILSARSSASLALAHTQLADYLETHPETDLDDAAFTLATRRANFNVRNAVVSTSLDGTVARLREAAALMNGERSLKDSVEKRETVFVFPGQGVQYAGMGKSLYREMPVFAETVDYCAKKLLPIMGLDIRELLFASASDEDAANERLRQTEITQPAIFVIEYALAKLWMSFGVFPDAMVGHSIGQYAAACLSGVFSLDDCLTLVAARGKVIQAMAPGSMLSVPAAAAVLREKLGDTVSIASVNAPGLCVASGPSKDIEDLQKILEQEGIAAKVLRTSHAFHSKMMDEAVVEFGKIARGVTMNAPSIPFVCTATGDWITDAQAMDPGHWADQIRAAVLFSPAVEKLMADRNPCIFLEVGPRNTMTSLIKQHIKGQGNSVALTSLGKKEAQDEGDFFSIAVGQFYQSRGVMNLDSQFENYAGMHVSLPTYAFEPNSHWIPPVRSDFLGSEIDAIAALPINSDVEVNASSVGAQFTPIERFLSDLWGELLGVTDAGLDDDFFDVGGHSLIGIPLLDRVKAKYQVALQLSDFLEKSTIRKMAKEIEELLQSGDGSGDVQSAGIKRKSWSPLVLLSKGSNRAPVFCVAGIGGHVMELKQLANQLGDIPFYGLETRGVVEGHVPHDTIEAMAREHIEAIRTIQPQGPYHLCGYSFGGVVAFEMATQLSSVNEEIAWLGFIDSGSPVLPKRTHLDFRRVQLKRFAQNPRVTALNFISRRIQAKKNGPVVKDRYDHIYETMSKARENYRPKPYSGDAVLFRTPKSELFDDIFSVIDDYNGWLPLIKGKLDVVPVRGHHLSVVQELPNAKYLAKKMRQSLLERNNRPSVF